MSAVCTVNCAYCGTPYFVYDECGCDGSENVRLQAENARLQAELTAARKRLATLDKIEALLNYGPPAWAVEAVIYEDENQRGV